MMVLKKVCKALAALMCLLFISLILLFTFSPVSNPKILLQLILGSANAEPDITVIESRLKMPEGFSISVYAEGLKKVRMLEFSRTGDLIASQPRDGNVLLIKPNKNDASRAENVEILLGGLKRPHGLAFAGDWLYIAESDAVGRIRFNHTAGITQGEYQRVVTGLTDNGGHWTKSLRINGDKLYVSMGSTCNVCEEEDKRRATIMQFNLDGSEGKIYANGLRNSVGLDFAPWDNALYATDNGRDLLGDDYPVCELNKIEEGQFYGWPYINGFGDLDPDMGQGQEALLETAISPSFGFAAHNAPLGIRFIRNAYMPEGFEKSALVALHGSWNRTIPDGYKVISLHWQEDGSISSKDLISGFEQSGNIIGRPVDIAEGPDGCLFVSDDYAGVVYRVCYQRNQPPLSVKPAKSVDINVASATDDDKKALKQQGQVLYISLGCSGCHLLNGEGNTRGKALNKLAARYTLQSLSDYFLSPNPPMPQYALDELQRTQLSAYLLGF